MRTILRKVKSHSVLLGGKETLSGGYPWLTPGAILAIEDITRRKKESFRVLEMGSGGSTVFFSNRCLFVLSLENDPFWEKAVRNYLPQPSNVELICKPTPKLLPIINQQPNNHFDIVLADLGFSYRWRRILAEASKPKLKRGGWLILDNYAVKRLQSFDYTGFEVYTFDTFAYSGRGTRLCRKL